MSKKIENTAFVIYMGAVFVSAFAGVGGGRILLALSLLFLSAHLIEQRRRPVMPAVGWWTLAYASWISLAIVWGPEESGEGLHKHLPWLQIPLAAMLVTTPQRLLRVFKAYAAGAGVLAARVFYETLSTSIQSCREGLSINCSGWAAKVFQHQNLDDSDIIARLVDQGGMQDGQRLVVGLLAIAACLYIMPRKTGAHRIMWALVIPVFMALVLTFKRGAWLALIIVFSVALFHAAMQTQLLSSLKHRVRRAHLLGALFVIILVLYGLVASGITAQLQQTADEQLHNMINAGGRTCMWVEITPELVRRYPWGIGFKTLNSDMMRAIAPQVEKHHNHVHSNIMQSLVDGGWLGLLLFCGWMISAFAAVLRHAGFLKHAGGFRFTHDNPDQCMGYVLWLMLLALFIMGLFEYQIGTGQIVLLYGMIMGCAAAGAQRQQKRGQRIMAS